MVKYSLCPQTCSFPDILDFFLSCTHTHTHIINIFPLDWIFPSAVLRELQNTPGFCPHRRLIPHSSLSSLLNWVGSMTHSSDVYIYCQQCLYAAVYLCIYTCLYVNSCIFFFYAHMYPACTQLHCSEFQLQLVPARPARVGDEVPAGVTGAGGYYACGANVATEACGRERGREGGGEVLTGE